MLRVTMDRDCYYLIYYLTAILILIRITLIISFIISFPRRHRERERERGAWPGLHTLERTEPELTVPISY